MGGHGQAQAATRRSSGHGYWGRDAAKAFAMAHRARLARRGERSRGRERRPAEDTGGRGKGVSKRTQVEHDVCVIRYCFCSLFPHLCPPNRPSLPLAVCTPCQQKRIGAAAAATGRRASRQTARLVAYCCAVWVRVSFSFGPLCRDCWNSSAECGHSAHDEVHLQAR